MQNMTSTLQISEIIFPPWVKEYYITITAPEARQLQKGLHQVLYITLCYQLTTCKQPNDD